MGNLTKEEMMLSYMSLTSIIMLHLVWGRIYTLVLLYIVYGMVITLISCYKGCTHCLNWKSKGCDTISLKSIDVCYIGVLKVLVHL
jgi:hypothetical protein